MLRRLIGTILTGFVLAGPASGGVVRSYSIMLEGDRFDLMAYDFPILDWISFARDEYIHLVSIQPEVFPAYGVSMMNETATDVSVELSGRMSIWELAETSVIARHATRVPSPCWDGADKKANGSSLIVMISMDGRVRGPRRMDMVSDMID